jgi:hypothetical protein
MIPDEVVMTMVPNKRDGNKRPTHSSMSWCDKSYLGEMTPHLLILPFSSTTILPAL